MLACLYVKMTMAVDNFLHSFLYYDKMKKMKEESKMIEDVFERIPLLRLLVLFFKGPPKASQALEYQNLINN
jgi:hypothetical protein